MELKIGGLCDVSDKTDWENTSAAGGTALLVKIGMEISSFILGALMLIVFGCIIFTIVQHTWNSMAILIVMEVFLILITAGTGVIEGVLQMASESLGGFMRS